MDIFSDIAKSIGALYTEQRELEAIWLERPIQTPEGRKIRITTGDTVKVENGMLVDCTENATHVIFKCLGTLVSQFELLLMNLQTGEELRLKI